VAVQGPPGTGKTHTIANIVCHFLATGRKVLVTSKGEQALEVLKSKIPAEVQPLTVALLAGDREGMRQFQSSIEAIIHNVSHLNPEVVREQIAAAHSGIERAHEELAQIDRRVSTIWRGRSCPMSRSTGCPCGPQKMAELVVREASQHAWFDDEIGLSPEHTPPLSAEQFSALREARRRLGADLVYVLARVPRQRFLAGRGRCRAAAPGTQQHARTRP
jgi:RecA/RadA recombinase